MDRLVLLLLMLLLTGCGHHQSPGGTSPAAPSPVTATLLSWLGRPPSFRHWQAPPPGTMVAWQTLPAEVQEVVAAGPRARNGRWVANVWTHYSLSPEAKDAIEREEPALAGAKRGPRLWFGAPDLGIAAMAPHLDDVRIIRFLWTTRSTLLYYRAKDDTWLELDPASAHVTPFLPAVLKGRSAGNLRFSPDGAHLLYDTPVCNDCNKQRPGQRSTFVVGLDGTGGHRIATWWAP